MKFHAPPPVKTYGDLTPGDELKVYDCVKHRSTSQDELGKLVTTPVLILAPVAKSDWTLIFYFMYDGDLCYTTRFKTDHVSYAVANNPNYPQDVKKLRETK